MDQPPPLVLTGERTLPGIGRENYWFRRHEAVYTWAAELPLHAAGAVLDAGCGEGYGVSLLASTLGRPALGLDYDAATCAHAHRAYPELGVSRANLAALPVRPGSCALTVSLQVLEHLWEPRAFLASAVSTLAPGGLLVVSTPHRLTFSPGVGRGERPLNPFHVEEFDAAQMAELLDEAGLADVRVLGLRHTGRLAVEESVHGPIVPAQVSAILDEQWSPELEERVAAVTVDDFAIDDADEACLDLVALGMRR